MDGRPRADRAHQGGPSPIDHPDWPPNGPGRFDALKEGLALRCSRARFGKPVPVPDFQSLMLPTLRALSEKTEMRLSEVRERVADAEELSPQDRQERVPSGRQAKFENRISWALTHMRRAGLVQRVHRGVYSVTEHGRELLDDGCSRVDMRVLRQHPSYAEWQSAPRPPQPMATPEEALEQAAQDLAGAVEAELLKRVKDADPEFLEQVAVDLLIAMGYGGSDSSMGRATRRSADGGIDGVIKEDQLGLDEVYVQAKRYATGNSVGESELRNVAGHRARPRAYSLQPPRSRERQMNT